MSDESFKVIDKRRFNDDSSAEEKVVEEVKPVPKVQASEPSPAADTPHRQESSSETSIDFSSFVVSMATQGLMMLGEVPHPETGESLVSLEAAKQTIDILSVIEEKTKGNLTKDEERLIGEVIASLRLAYISKNKS